VDLIQAMTLAVAEFDAALAKHYPEERLTLPVAHAISAANLRNIVSAANGTVAKQITSPTQRHLQAKASGANPVESICAIVDQWHIKKALFRLWEIDDRDGWQADLIAALLAQEARGIAGYDPFQDGRLGKLVPGLAVFFRLFELRPDYSFRHQPQKFDGEGFFQCTPPWSYADAWLETIPPEDLERTEAFLNAAGVLEIKEVWTRSASVSGIRLRGDLIVEYLKQIKPEKYGALGESNI
jgi:hypothetical protein